MAVVSGRLEGRDLGSAVAEIRVEARQLKLPIGYTYEIGGQYQAQGQAFRELLMVFALAVVLVFTILVIQFRAWLPAMLILLAAPLSLGGALLLLWLTGTDLNISSAMGLILLVGLVVKNGIMLLDFSETAARGGRAVRSRDCARRPDPPAPDPDDDVLHAVRPASAGARPWRRRRAAAAAGARCPRRFGAVDTGDPARGSRAIRGDSRPPNSFGGVVTRSNSGAMVMPRLFAVILCLCSNAAAVYGQEPAAPPAATGPARIVVTITVEGLRIPLVRATLRSVDRNVTVAQSTSDAIGQVTFPDIPPGRYVVDADREGFANAKTAPFEVSPGETEQVLVEMRLTFVRETVEVVAPANSPTESLQPVAVSDVLTGAKMDIQPLAGDDFQSLLTVLPSIVRDPQGRLRIKGGSPTSGALQISSASLNDPSTGDFDLELPSGAVESVEVLSNPFAAEYGRFSTSVTQVRTKRGTNDWIIKPDNLVPGFGKGFAFVNKFEPRFSISGPIKHDKLLFGQYFQYRFARTEVKSLPGRPQLGLDSFDSFTRLDAVLSSRHALTTGLIYFPRKISNATMSTFRPEDTTPKFTQSGFSVGAADRLILSAHAVLESTIALRIFEVDQKSKGDAADDLRAADAERQLLQPPGAQRPQLSGRRGADLLQGVGWRPPRSRSGIDLQHVAFDGDSFSQQLDVVRLDGSLAERTTYSPLLANPDVTGTEFAVFAQDRWRVNDRLMFELGFRVDNDDIVDRANYSPRVGMSYQPASGRPRDSARRVREVLGEDATDVLARSRNTRCRRPAGLRPMAACCAAPSRSRT